LLPDGLAYRAGEGRVNARNGILLHPGDHMAIGVQGQSNGRMAQALRGDLRVHARS